MKWQNSWNQRGCVGSSEIVSRSNAFIELATFFQHYHSIPNAKVEIPFVKLMRIAVALQNRRELFESGIASNVLALTNVATINPDDVHAIIKSVQNHSKFPQTWASPFFDVAVRIEGIDLRLLSEFWAAVNCERKGPIWLRSMPHHAIWPQTFAIVAELLKLQDHAALDLATQLLAHCPEVPSEISYEMNRRAASGLLDSDSSDARRSTFVRCLFRSKPTLGEAKCYSDLNLFKTICDSSPHADEQIVTKINAMPQTFPKEQFPSLRVELERLLSRKEDYPPEICAAALDVLIQLDVINCPPISEADWRGAS